MQAIRKIEAASSADLAELTRLYIAYRVFYGEAPQEQRAAEFIRERVLQSSVRYFLAWHEGAAVGFRDRYSSASCGPAVGAGETS